MVVPESQPSVNFLPQFPPGFVFVKFPIVLGFCFLQNFPKYISDIVVWIFCKNNAVALLSGKIKPPSTLRREKHINLSTLKIIYYFPFFVSCLFLSNLLSANEIFQIKL